jgi:hypothetical protein
VIVVTHDWAKEEMSKLPKQFGLDLQLVNTVLSRFLISLPVNHFLHEKSEAKIHKKALICKTGCIFHKKVVTINIILAKWACPQF